MDQFFDSLKAHNMDDFRSDGRRARDESYQTPGEKTSEPFVENKRDMEQNLTVIYCSVKDSD